MIYIDDRVGSRELLPKLRKGTQAEIKRLSYADAMFVGEGPDDELIPIGIERKTITDLVSSISSGRLTSHQLVGLLRTYQYVYLLVEGIYRTNPQNGILEYYRSAKWKPISLGSRRFMGSAIHSYLNRLAVFYNIKIAYTPNLVQSGCWLSSIYSWWKKPWDKHDAHAGFYVQPLPTHKCKEGSPIPVADLIAPPFTQRVIKEFSGVGWKKSEAVMAEFPTMEDITAATVEDFKRVPGIGKALAESMYLEARKKG